MPTFDPTLPAANSLISSSELRDQFNALDARITDLETEYGYTALSVNGVAHLTLTISSPPTQAEVQAIHDKINEMLGDLFH